MLLLGVGSLDRILLLPEILDLLDLLDGVGSFSLSAPRLHRLVNHGGYGARFATFDGGSRNRLAGSSVAGCGHVMAAPFLGDLGLVAPRGCMSLPPIGGWGRLVADRLCEGLKFLEISFAHSAGLSWIAHLGLLCTGD